MSLFNRLFVSILLIGYLVALGAGLVLVWQPEESIEASNDTYSLGFDLNFATDSEKTLATIAIIALMLPAVGLLGAELAARDRRRVVEARPVDSVARTESRPPEHAPASRPDTYPVEHTDPPRRRRFFGRA
jgi:hypothetical protein